jgi:multidrug resistance efflux pump
MMTKHNMTLCISVFVMCLLAFVIALFSSKAQAARDRDGKWYSEEIKQSAINVAKARLNVAKADEQACIDELKHYKEEWDRAQKLIKTGAISQSEHTEISRRYIRFSGECMRSKARTAEARALLEYAELTGEIDKALTNRHE